jgi:hypothetical protein
MSVKRIFANLYIGPRSFESALDWQVDEKRPIRALGGFHQAATNEHGTPTLVPVAGTCPVQRYKRYGTDIINVFGIELTERQRKRPNPVSI